MKRSSARVAKVEGQKIEDARKRRRNIHQGAIRVMQDTTANVTKMGQTDFELGPGMLPAPLPSHKMDFDLPTDWKDKRKSKSRKTMDDVSLGKGKHLGILPPGIPYYRQLRQNLYRSPLNRDMFRDTDPPVCNCIPELGCDEDCQNRMLYMECAPGCCPTNTSNDVSKHSSSSKSMEKEEDVDDDGDNKQQYDAALYCENTCIQRRSFPKTIVKGTPQCGFGLFVDEDVKADTILIEYLGEVITEEEMTERMSEYALSDDFYFASLGTGLFLDAKPMGSTARFANHSCDPTCTLSKWTVMGEPRIVLVAGRDLLKGEEITYNYQYFADGLDSNKKGISKFSRQKCLCGSSNCSGTIGGKVEKRAEDFWREKAHAILFGVRSNKRGRHDLRELTLEFIGVEAQAAGIPEDDQDIEDLKDLCEQALEWIECADKILQCHGTLNTLTATNEKEVETEIYKKTGVRRYPNRFNGNISINSMSLISRDDLKLFIEEAPDSIKLPQLQSLKMLLKKAHDAEKNANWVVTQISTDNVAGNNNSSSSTSKNTTNGQRRVYFDDMMLLLKDIQKALPIYCESSYTILSYYQETANWVRMYLRGVVPKSFELSSVPPNDKNLVSWNILRTVASTYGYPAISDDVFYVTAFLEDRCNMAAMRGKNEQEKTLELYSFDTTTDTADAYLNGPRHTLRMHSEPPFALHCFCQLPEEHSEIKTFICCDKCDKWFHPNCINRSNSSVNIIGKRAFYCPLCEYQLGYPSDFCYTSTHEWKLTAAHSSLIGSPSAANSTKKNQPIVYPTFDLRLGSKEEYLKALYKSRNMKYIDNQKDVVSKEKTEENKKQDEGEGEDDEKQQKCDKNEMTEEEKKMAEEEKRKAENKRKQLIARQERAKLMVNKSAKQLRKVKRNRMGPKTVVSKVSLTTEKESTPMQTSADNVLATSSTATDTSTTIPVPESFVLSPSEPVSAGSPTFQVRLAAQKHLIQPSKYEGAVSYIDPSHIKDKILHHEKSLKVCHSPLLQLLHFIQERWQFWKERVDDAMKEEDIHSIGTSGWSVQRVVYLPQAKSINEIPGVSVSNKYNALLLRATSSTDSEATTSSSSSTAENIRVASGDNSELITKSVIWTDHVAPKCESDVIRGNQIMMSRLCKLYYEMRVLRIYDEPRLANLRRCIWTISSSRIVRIVPGVHRFAEAPLIPSSLAFPLARMNDADANQVLNELYTNLIYHKFPRLLDPSYAYVNYSSLKASIIGGRSHGLGQLNQPKEALAPSIRGQNFIYRSLWKEKLYIGYMLDLATQVMNLFIEHRKQIFLEEGKKQMSLNVSNGSDRPLDYKSMASMLVNIEAMELKKILDDAVATILCSEKYLNDPLITTLFEITSFNVDAVRVNRPFLQMMHHMTVCCDCVNLTTEYVFVQCLALMAKMKDKNEKEYCWCRRGEDFDTLIQCDCCTGWVHTNCCIRSISQRVLQKSSYTCIGCCTLQGQEYKFKWTEDRTGF